MKDRNQTRALYKMQNNRYNDNRAYLYNTIVIQFNFVASKYGSAVDEDWSFPFGG